MRDGDGAVVGVGMRTASFAPYPAYLLPMPDEAAVALARLLHERGEALTGVNGAAGPAHVLLSETARLAGGSVQVHERMRLWEVTEVTSYDAPGSLRPARPGEADLVTAWWNVFSVEAAAMAGRTAEAGSGEQITRDEAVRRIEAGLVWLWEDPDGQVVHLSAHNAPAYGVVRVGPVITPRPHRGRGHASAAVSQVSARLLADGHRACLFTDLDNPTSNKIYAAIGYRPLVDMANLVIS